MIRSIAGASSLGVVVVVTLVAGGCSSSDTPSGDVTDAGSSSGIVGSSGSSGSGSRVVGSSSSSGSGSGGVGSSGSGSGTTGSSSGSSSSSGSGSSSGGGAGVNLPLVTPLVRAATPSGLQGSTQAYAFAGGFHFEDQPVGDAGDDGAPAGDTCPGGGGVCPDGGMNGGPGGDGGMPPPGDTCPGSGGVCPDGGMNGGPGGDGGMPPPGGPGGDAGASGSGTAGLDPTDIRSRFFQAGPTNIFAILADLDGRISEVNQRSASGNVPCLSATPVAYTLTPFGQSVTFYAQCVSDLSGPMDPGGFFEFGMKDGVVYLYEKVGAGAIGARITPVAEGSAQYSVEAWMGVGYKNAASCGNDTGFDDCSYGMMAIEADAERAHLELSVAGVGFGYCGAQLVSNGTTVYVAGSLDMGSTCDPTANACVSASDLTAAPTCATTSFDLPAVGRAATTGPNGTWAASAYGSANVVLNGSGSDALAFGPAVATPGVGSFSAAMGGPGDGGAMNGPGDGSAMPPNVDGGAE